MRQPWGTKTPNLIAMLLLLSVTGCAPNARNTHSACQWPGGGFHIWPVVSEMFAMVKRDEP
jgi:hypothetical protein